jgi:hypothetical protein
VNFKRFAATATMAGALGVFAALGLGAGPAQAKPGGNDWCGPIQCPDFDAPPGQVGVGPPGQFKKDPYWPVFPIENPYYGVPPGHWDEVNPWPWPH